MILHEENSSGRACGPSLADYLLKEPNAERGELRIFELEIGWRCGSASLTCVPVRAGHVDAPVGVRSGLEDLTA